MDPEAGFLLRDSVVLAVEVLECCPWCACGPVQHHSTASGLVSNRRRSDGQVTEAAPQYGLSTLGGSGGGRKACPVATRQHKSPESANTAELFL